jgi:hypothetical protein
MTLSLGMYMYFGTAHGILAPSATGTAGPYASGKLFTSARDGTWHLASATGHHTPVHCSKGIVSFIGLQMCEVRANRPS